MESEGLGKGSTFILSMKMEATHALNDFCAMNSMMDPMNDNNIESN